MKNHETKIEQTRRKIVIALINLSKKKNVQQISVSELCRESGINRSTFYLHYHDINDLVEKVSDRSIQHVFDYIKKRQKASKEMGTNHDDAIIMEYQDVIKALQTAQQEKDIIQMLISSNGLTEFRAQLRELLRELFGYLFADYLPQARKHFRGIPLDYVDTILLDTPVNVLMLWVEKGMFETPEEMGKILMNVKFATPLAFIDEK